jgi:hypothetical protein
MCRAISILKSRINRELLEEYDLRRRIRQRAEDAAEELVFDFAEKETPLLPVIEAGEMRIYEWGNRGRAGKLPPSGWCRLESLEAGKWKWLAPESIIIPAQFGLEKGVWFAITEGIQGVVVQDENERPHAYMLTQPASVYYLNMTKHDRMPMLVGEQI